MVVEGIHQLRNCDRKIFGDVTFDFSFVHLLSLFRFQSIRSSQQPVWLSLNDLIMEKIFQQLLLHGRFNASLVCNVLIIFWLKFKDKYKMFLGKIPNKKNTEFKNAENSRQGMCRAQDLYSRMRSLGGYFLHLCLLFSHSFSLLYPKSPNMNIIELNINENI